jgi:nuclear mRNA export protein PCID2/THP1
MRKNRSPFSISGSVPIFSDVMALVTQFLTSIRGFVLDQDGDKLRDWLRVERGVPSQYYELGQELRSQFSNNGKLLDQLVERTLPEEDDVPDGKGSPWPGFISFMREYLHYWRVNDFEDLIKCYQLLSNLVT